MEKKVFYGEDGLGWCGGVEVGEGCTDCGEYVCVTKKKKEDKENVEVAVFVYGTSRGVWNNRS